MRLPAAAATAVRPHSQPSQKIEIQQRNALKQRGPGITFLMDSPFRCCRRRCRRGTKRSAHVIGRVVMRVGVVLEQLKAEGVLEGDRDEDAANTARRAEARYLHRFPAYQRCHAALTFFLTSTNRNPT